MVNQFKRQFWVHHERMKDAISLADIKQGESESLGDYVKRFNHAAARVKGPDERLMHYALIAGVRKGTAFAQKLLMKKTEGLQDFCEKADRYMRLEESELERKKSEAKNASTPGAESSKKKNGENSQKGSGVKRDGKNDNGQGGQKRGRFNNSGERTGLYIAYTALTRPRAEIYEATRDKVAYHRPPPREATEEEKNSGRYCRFHMMAGHETNACRHLKDLIEDYIQKHNEHLTRFVQKPRGQGNQQQQQSRVTPAQPGVRNNDNQERTSGQKQVGPRIVETICGGPHIIESGRRAREAFAVSLDDKETTDKAITEVKSGKQPRLDEEVVTFSKRDLDGTEYPNTDPLVISTTLGTALVKRILIDNGSSVYVLFKHAFDQMGMSPEDIQPCNIPIHGFAGDGIVPVGMITLPLTVGTAPRTVTRMQDFIILESPSAYNAFLGRPGLSALRATTAVWCLAMKFPTPNGTGVVHGDQAAARKCYVTEVDKARKVHTGKAPMSE